MTVAVMLASAGDAALYIGSLVAGGVLFIVAGFVRRTLRRRNRTIVWQPAPESVATSTETDQAEVRRAQIRVAMMAFRPALMGLMLIIVVLATRPGPDLRAKGAVDAVCLLIALVGFAFLIQYLVAYYRVYKSPRGWTRSR